MRASLRLLAGLFLLIAVIFAVNDATHALAGRSGTQVTVLETWSAVSAVSLKATQGALERYSHPLVWQWGVLPVLRLPAWTLFCGLGLLLSYAGRRRRQTNVYAN